MTVDPQAIDTIAAIATPPGRGGVGIVRVSGPAAIAVAAAMVARPLQPRQATLATFLDAGGDRLDSGIALLFLAPNSFTGEHVLELQGHGGPVVMDMLLERVLELGARPARPGEFTERAFLNGKLDLVQAEAVADLIASSSRLAARLATRSLQGVFSRRVEALTERLIQLRTAVEADLDFPDEGIDLDAEARIHQELVALIAKLEDLLATATQGEIIRSGLRVVIAGPPNAGKSSLLNALSQTDTAIVTHIPGTTRDVLSVDIQVEGLPIRLSDTAGLRASDDPVEQEGVRRARGALANADLVLWVYDATRPQDAVSCSDIGVQCPVIRIRNKIDQLAELPSCHEDPAGTEIALSALQGRGIDHLHQALKRAAGLAVGGECDFSARRRHLDALRRAGEHLGAAQTQIACQAGAELIAEELRLAQRELGQITGAVTADDLLGRIFSSFCIGK